MNNFLSKCLLSLFVSILCVAPVAALQVNVTIGQDIKDSGEPKLYVYPQIKLKYDYRITENSGDNIAIHHQEMDFRPVNIGQFQNDILPSLNRGIGSIPQVNVANGDYFNLTLGYLDFSNGYENRKLITPFSCEMQIKSGQTNILFSKNGCVVI